MIMLLTASVSRDVPASCSQVHTEPTILSEGRLLETLASSDRAGRPSHVCRQGYFCRRRGRAERTESDVTALLPEQQDALLPLDGRKQAFVQARAESRSAGVSQRWRATHFLSACTEVVLRALHCQPDVTAAVGDLQALFKRVADDLGQASGAGVQVRRLVRQCHRQFLI